MFCVFFSTCRWSSKPSYSEGHPGLFSRAFIWLIKPHKGWKALSNIRPLDRNGFYVNKKCVSKMKGQKWVRLHPQGTFISELWKKGRGPSIFGDMITLSFFDQSMGVPSTGIQKNLTVIQYPQVAFPPNGPCVKVIQYHIVICFVRVAVRLMRGSKGSKILNLRNSGGSLSCHKTIQVEWIVLLENDNSYLYVDMTLCPLFLWVIYLNMKKTCEQKKCKSKMHEYNVQKHYTWTVLLAHDNINKLLPQNNNCLDLPKGAKWF